MAENFITRVDWIDGNTYILQREPTKRHVVPSKMQRDRVFAAALVDKCLDLIEAYYIREARGYDGYIVHPSEYLEPVTVEVADGIL